MCLSFLFHTQTYKLYFTFAECSDYSRIVTSTISAIPLAINGQATTHKFTDCQVQATSLVVGGSKAKLGEFPHMVMIEKKKNYSFYYWSIVWKKMTIFHRFSLP